MPALETDRLILRDFTLEDWAAINEVLSDPDVTRYMHFAAWTQEQRRAWLHWSISNSLQPTPDAYNWAVCIKEGNWASRHRYAIHAHEYRALGE